LARLAKGYAHACNYTVNNHQYTQGYYLADYIYPPWSVFVKAVSNPQNKKEAEFSKMQEACRKDIERAFGVLQAWFAIVCGPARFWDKRTLWNITACCVILHNMIIEDERDLNMEFFYDNVGSCVKPTRNPDEIQAFLETYHNIENAETHWQLKNDPLEHHWQSHGGE
jgi:hypothetical protein